MLSIATTIFLPITINTLLKVCYSFIDRPKMLKAFHVHILKYSCLVLETIFTNYIV